MRAEPRSHWRAIVAILILAAGALWIGRVVTDHRHDFASVRALRLDAMAWLVGLTLGVMVVNGLYTRHAAAAFGVFLAAREWLGMSVASTAINLFVPRSGVGLRAARLATRYRVPPDAYLGAMLYVSGLYVLAFSLLGLAALLALHARGVLAPGAIDAFFGVVAAGAALFLVLPPPLARAGGGMLRRRFGLGAHGLSARGNPALFVRLAIDILLAMMLSLLQSRVAFAAFGLRIDWPAAMLYTAGQALALLVTLTPGALGIAESMAVAVGKALGYSAPQALMVQAALRGALLVALLVASPLALGLLSARRDSTPS